MAWTTVIEEAISTDTPIVCVKNILANPGQGGITALKDAGGTDLTHADFPFDSLFDWFGHRVCKPDASPATTWHINFVIDSSNAGEAARVLVIIGHNFELGGGDSVDVKAYTADNNAYTTREELMHDFGAVSTNDRLVALPLESGGDAYTNLERFQLRLVGTAAFVPQISEVYLGPHEGFYHGPDQGEWDDRELRSRVTRVESKTGVITKYGRKKGQQIFRMSNTIDSAADLAEHRRTFDDADWGSSFGILIPKPVSDLQEAHIVDVPDNFYAPFIAPAARQRSMVFHEQYPFRAVEAAE